MQYLPRSLDEAIKNSRVSILAYQHGQGLLNLLGDGANYVAVRYTKLYTKFSCLLALVIYYTVCHPKGNACRGHERVKPSGAVGMNMGETKASTCTGYSLLLWYKTIMQLMALQGLTR